MASDFFYFLSTLPALTMPSQPGDAWGGPCWDEFLAQCRRLLSARDAETVAALELCPPAAYLADTERAGAGLPSLARDWYDWQVVMRNALARRRAARRGGRGITPRPEAQAFPNDVKRLDALFEQAAPVERAWAWYALQWSRLDELAAREQFNLNVVAAYALKVRLMEEARRYDRARGAEAFKGMVDGVVAAAQARRVAGTTL